jgi:hypothetical protein
VVAGPALGGVLHGIAGASVVYGIAAAFEAAAALGILSLRSSHSRERAKGGLQEAVAGWLFVRRQPVILGALSLDLFAVLLGGAVALLPIYARDILCSAFRGAFGT